MRISCPNCQQEIKISVETTTRRQPAQTKTQEAFRPVAHFARTLGDGRWTNHGLRITYDDWCKKYNGPELTSQQLSSCLTAAGLKKWRDANDRGFLVTPQWRAATEAEIAADLERYMGPAS